MRGRGRDGNRGLGRRYRLRRPRSVLNIPALIRRGSRRRPGRGHHPGLPRPRRILYANFVLHLVLLLLRRLDDLIRHLRRCRGLRLLLLQQPVIRGVLLCFLLRGGS